MRFEPQDLSEMRMRSTIRERIAAVLLASLLGTRVPAPQPQKPQAAPQKPSEPGFRVRVTTEIVLVNVIARDKKGNLIRDLKQSDLTVYEDGQKQQISSFDFENVDALQTAGAAGETITGAAGNAGSLLGTTQAASLAERDP